MFKIQPSGHKDLILTWPERGVLRDDFFDVVLLEERRKHVDDAGAERRQDEEGAAFLSAPLATICRGEMQDSFTRHLGLLKIRAHPKNKRRVFLLLISDLDLKEKERREEKGGCFTPLVRTAVTDISPLRPPRPSSAMEPKK